jgi:bifunctional DNA-binding transcriptional regulator/antitoxin component of YhaV-PrlF toxin-antitoxin module
MTHIEEHESAAEIRKVQALTGERSLTFVLPKTFARELGIERGDFLKVHMESKRLILEKAEV